MKNIIEFELISEPFETFRCIKAANSVDLNLSEKLKHYFKVECEFPELWNIGLIVGSSGSGKTTLAKYLYTEDCFSNLLKEDIPVLEQFDKKFSYDECAKYLCSVGLSQVPCWVRPAKTLSNGQKFRAEIALQLANNEEKICVIDEWTSVVDRTVAKVMSHTIQKHARKFSKQIEWIDPDWIIDCNIQEFRRGLRKPRTEKLKFDVRQLQNGKSWKYFSKYHYLNNRLAGGKNYFFGLFDDNKQIGFTAYSNYVPHVDKTKKMILHSNRCVIHPDYVGFGLGQKFVDVTSFFMHEQGFRILAKFSSLAFYKTRMKSKIWKLINEGYFTHGAVFFADNKRSKSCRNKQKWWSFEFVPSKD
jgi:hypothetical protein